MAPPPPQQASFALLSDDLALNILAKLESDPRDWARLSCVSTRLAGLVHNVCCRSRCMRTIPAVVSDLVTPGGWAALHKLCVSCPGLHRAGVLLEHSDFGLHLDIGPDVHPSPPHHPQLTTSSTSSSSDLPITDHCWSLFDDLYYDTIYDISESHLTAAESTSAVRAGCELPRKRKKHSTGPAGAHLASGVWSLSREQGNKLLASRFRDDCLYICDWPGCVHAEEKRKYMLFRGVFKNFRRSRVWRTINDGNKGKIALECAFCSCKETWDLHSAFCLRSFFGFHDDGEPVVRAYVCENGHVSGAWTERPMFA